MTGQSVDVFGRIDRMRTIHRTLAWLLAMLVLVSLLCPAMAFAGADSDQDQIQQSSKEADNTGLPADTPQVDSNLTGQAGSAEEQEAGAVDSNKAELSANDTRTDSSLQGQEDSGEKQEVGTDDTNNVDISSDNTQLDTNQENQASSGENENSESGTEKKNETDPEKQERNTADASDRSDQQKSQTGSLEKKSNDTSSAGSLSSADGSQKQSRRSSVMELFISENGSDETGNGTCEAPFATLNAALEFAGDSDVEIILSLMTDLCLSETVPVVGNVVTVTGDDGIKTITRAEDFNGHFDPEEEHSTALFEVGTTDPENNPGGSLLIEGIVIDEKFMQTNPLQDSMIEVYDRGKLILGDDVLLLNYGGESAVHGWPGSEVVVSDGAQILDIPTVEKNETVAVQHDEGCTYSQGAASIILSHGEEYDEVYGEKQEEDSGGNGTGIKTNMLTGSSIGAETDTVTGSTSNTDDAGESKRNDSIDKEDTDNVNSGSEDDDDGEDGNENDGNKNPNEDGENSDQTQESSASESSQIQILKKAQSAGGLLMSSNTANGVLGAGNESSGIVYNLSAPERVSQKSTTRTINSYPASGTVQGYEIPYTVTLELGDLFGSAGAVAVQTLNAADIELSLELDKLLYPETTAVGQNNVNLVWEYTFMNASAVYDSGTSTVTVSLKADKESLSGTEDLASVLSSPLSLTVNTIVPSSTDFPQQAQVTGTLNLNKMTFSTGSWDRSTNVSPGEKTAVTKLFDSNKAATLVYDPNGGTGGPGTQELPAEKDHVLETENVPAHSDVNGTKVLFCGWTTEKDSKIYSDGETAPATVTALTLEEGKDPYYVYAVYSYDRNGDGTPDVKQKLLTLGFDGNAQNVSNVPGPIMKAATAGIASIDIPEQEPTRKYYTFLGWSEDENATEATYKYDADKAAYRDITISKDTLLYAVWKANPVYTLYFDGNGGTNVPAAQSARSDNGVANLTITKQIPARSGRTFVGWATQRYGTASFDPGEAVKLTGGDVTLYAVWERNSSWSNNAPKTGDESNVPLYAVLAVCSAGAAYAVYRILKKQKGK